MVVGLRWLARLAALFGLVWLLRGVGGPPPTRPTTPTPVAVHAVRLRARLAATPAPGSKLVFHFPEAALDVEVPCERLGRRGEVVEVELAVPTSAHRWAVTLRSPHREPAVSALTELGSLATLPPPQPRRALRPRSAPPASRPLPAPSGAPVLVKASLNDMIGPPREHP